MSKNVNNDVSKDPEEKENARKMKKKQKLNLR